MHSRPHHRFLCFTYLRISWFASFYTFPRGISWGRTCRVVHDLCSYPDLPHLVQTPVERCTVSDGMHPGLGHLERFRILENREEAGRRSISAIHTSPCLAPFNSTSTFYSSTTPLVTGTLLFGTRPSQAAHWHQSTVGYSYLSLPSLSDSQDPSQQLEWWGIVCRLQ